MSLEHADQSPWVNRILWFSAADVGLVTVARPFPELFLWGEELGDLMFDLGLAYVAAWVFHQLLVVRPQRAKATQLNAVLNPKLDRLVNVGRRLQQTLVDASPMTSVEFPASEEQVDALCSNISMSAPTGVFMIKREDMTQSPMSWSDYIDHVGRQSTAAHDELSALYPVLEPSLLSILERERTARIHNNLAVFEGPKIGFMTLEWCTSEFAEFIGICGDLEVYLKTRLRS